MSETRPIIRGTHACVASSNYMATAAGFEILLSGGNAFDAAVATGVALHVVEPHMNGIGGEAPAILFSAKSKRVLAISGQGAAPKTATLSFFQDRGIELVPGDGLLPATVPSSFSMWVAMLRKFGTMTLRRVLAPAIRLAEEGFPVYPRLQQSIRRHASRFLKEWPTTARVYLPNGRVPEVGQVLRQTELAQTLRKLVHAEQKHNNRSEGLTAANDFFYSGPIAEKIVRFSSTHSFLDATGEAHSGLIEVSDLAQYRSRIEETANLLYGGVRIHKCGPWSQGPVFLQQLRLLENYNLKRLKHNSPDYIHLVTEASKLAFADREEYYGDPLYSDIPMETLLSRKYARRRAKLIDVKKASLELRPGDVSSALQGSNVWSEGDTTHLDVADSAGNMVSVTPSGGWIWESPVVEGLGFPLGTRGQMFSLKLGHPNCIAPGKRPRTTLSPTLVTKGGKPFLAFGTPGGDQQDQWTLQFFLNFIVFGMNLQSAIDAPSFHTDHFPSSFFPRKANPGMLSLEGRIPSDVVAELRRRGHRVVVEEDWVNGRVTAVHFEQDRKLISAAASSRFQTPYAIGF